MRAWMARESLDPRRLAAASVEGSARRARAAAVQY
jgi:hypothetical protein